MNVERTTELKVGSLVLVVLALIFYMSFQMSEDASFGRSKTYWFYVPDASGLLKKSAVKMAGIDIGIIRDIKLKDGVGYVEISVRSDLAITKGSRIEIKASGILGDKYVEVVQASIGGEILPAGSQIIEVRDVGSMSALMNEVGKIASSLGGVAKSLEAAATGEGDKDSPIGRIINNLEVFTADLSEISNGRKSKIQDVIDNIHDISIGLSEVFNEVNNERFKTMFSQLSNTMDKLDESMENFRQITRTISSGEGTLGKLIYDETTVDNVNETIGQVSEFFGQTSKIRTNLDFHSTFLFDHSDARSNLTLKIQPGLDRFYEIGIVDDPFGVREVETRIVDGGAPSTTETTFKHKVKFNALMAKNYFNLTLKAGIIENSGGLSINYHLYSDKLTWMFDAYDFSETNIRSSLRWSFYRGAYLIGGVDDILDKRTGTSGYLGLGIFLSNDDLKLLMAGLSL